MVTNSEYSVSLYLTAIDVTLWFRWFKSECMKSCSDRRPATNRFKFRGHQNYVLCEDTLILCTCYPPTVSLCTNAFYSFLHAHLCSGDEPMVILDTHLDWRFAKNVGSLFDVEIEIVS
jgi:hypothetical protein